jgi:hypothetical protein
MQEDSSSERSLTCATWLPVKEEGATKAEAEATRAARQAIFIIVLGGGVWV